MVASQTVTLANSIVGVSVLAMPFCFKQCGVVLATLMLVMGNLLTRTTNHFLLKAGTITRRRNYEMLAWDTFGPGGKFLVEISSIGFLIGTLIAFFVVMGDIGPEIASEVFNIDNNASLRNIIMAALCLFVALPLGLLRSIDSLSSISTVSVVFYIFLICKILGEGLAPLWTGSYLNRIDYWRPQGILQTLPIFSMALSCQTQVFGIYESLPDPSLQKMNDIVKQAVNICTGFYFCVGFFGYIGFSNQNFGGNILMILSPSVSTQIIKLCFLLTVVFSVPLVVFPCRASLNSLVFRRVHMHHSLQDASVNYIPDRRLKFLTVLIIGSTLFIGILIPNIELVLGLVGSTTGSAICIIFPSIMFIKVVSKQTTERILAQLIFFAGILAMVVSTYTNLYAVEKAQSQDSMPDVVRVTEIIKDIRRGEELSRVSFVSPDAKMVSVSPDLKIKMDELNKMKKDKEEKVHPPQVSPKSEVREQVIEKQPVKQKQQAPSSSPAPQPVVKQEIRESLKEPVRRVEEKLSSPRPAVKEERKEKSDVESPGAAQPDGKIPPEGTGNNHSAEKILRKLEVHQENQKKLLEEQRKILEELKVHHEQDIQRQQQDSVEKLPPPPPKKDPDADKLINGVDSEPKRDQVVKSETIDQSMIEKKVEVLKQEKLIERLSENIEKGDENVQIIEKIEEGLNKEIIAQKPEENPPNPPQNVQKSSAPHVELQKQPNPLLVGETIGKILEKVPPPSPGYGGSAPPQPDPVVKIQPPPLTRNESPHPHQQALPPSVVNMKPIPIQKKLEETPQIKRSISESEGDLSKKAKNATFLSEKDKPSETLAKPENTKGNTPEHERTIVDQKNKEKAAAAKEKEQSSKKPVDRDI